MTLSTAFLDEIRARTSLSALIGRTLKLKRAGREWKACCPFHQEKSASFTVSDDKGFWHCFGCGAHGDAIRWLTDGGAMQFMDAVKELADAAGLDMPARDPHAAQRDSRMDELREIMARAASFYAGALSPDVQGALDRRGIDARWVTEFGIGFAPASRKGDLPPLRTRLRDVPDDVVIELGLAKRGEDGGIYDFFRGRIIIPIHDARGRTIGFGGRIHGQGEPKYLNSPDTPLFDKGRTLFNLHRAAPAARRNGRMVIVEGYMDVIAMARAGIAESVAPNGTAITEHQLHLAWRQAAVPICCFDGDKAGQRAAARAARLALGHIEPGRSLAFAFPPTGQDPDDVLRESGPGAVSEMLASPRQLIDILWEEELAASQPLTSPDARADLTARLGKLVAQIKHHALALEYHAEFGRLYREQIRRTDRGGRRAPRSARPAVGLSAALEAGIVTGLLRHPAVVRDQFERISGIRWAGEGAIALVDMLIEAAISDRLVDDAVPVLLESRGLANTARAVQTAAQVPFSFVRADPSDATRAELIDALERMPRR